MLNYVPKIAAIHDISGVGRCSMTVILPILSALGCQVCPLPTAVLSNHSEYENFFFYDFTEHINEYYKYWKINDVDFDCVYSGFIGSEKQIDIILNIIDDIKSKNAPMVVVDPVMGDHGCIYKTYTANMIEKMSKLVKNADVVTPNLTEVSLLLNTKYSSEALEINTIKQYLKNLSDMGPNIAVITGIKTTDGEYINAAYRKTTNEYWKVPYRNIDVRYPGTGDLFTSLFVGYLMNEKSIPESIAYAASFVSMSVETTYAAGTAKKEGVLFEKIMKELYCQAKECKYTLI